MLIISLQADTPASEPVAFFYHAGLAQPILHHQHVLQAQRCTRLQLLIGDFQGRGRHPGQRLQEETQGTFLCWRL